MNEQSTDFYLEKLNSMSSSKEGINFINQNLSVQPGMTLKTFFDQYLAKHPETNANQIITASLVHRTYGHEILNGSKNGSRDRVIALCFAAGMNLDEINHALSFSKNNPLYAKNSRDAMIILAINLKQSGNADYSTVKKLNDYLCENGYEELNI